MLQAFYTVWAGEIPPDWASCLPAEYRGTVGSAGAPAYLLLAAALMRTAGNAAALQQLQRGPHGKPVFAGGRLHCSLSHSGSTALCVLGSTPCGADVQQPVPLRTGLVSYALGPQAAAYVQAGSVPQAAFAQAWALRESYLKYTGAGLSALRTAPDLYPGEDGIVGLPQGLQAQCFTLGSCAAAVCAPVGCLPPVYLTPQQCLQVLETL